MTDHSNDHPEHFWEHPDFDWEIFQKLANDGEYIFGALISEADAEKVNTAVGELLLRIIQGYLKLHGSIPEPLRSYAVRILGDVLETEPAGAAHALRIARQGQKGRRKGTAKHDQQLIDWYLDIKGQGIEPTVQNCTVKGCKDKTIKRFLKGELCKGCDFMIASRLFDQQHRLLTD